MKEALFIAVGAALAVYVLRPDLASKARAKVRELTGSAKAAACCDDCAKHGTSCGGAEPSIAVGEPSAPSVEVDSLDAEDDGIEAGAGASYLQRGCAS